MNNNNKIIITITIVALFLIITIPTLLKVYDRHNLALKKTMDNKIVEATKKCLNEEKCDEEDKVTLKELYQKKYLKKIINPKTNKEVNSSTYIDPIDFKITYYE